MARTPLASILQKSFAMAGIEMDKQSGTGQAFTLKHNNSQDTFLTHDMVHNGVQLNQRIVIVGAGLAGLTCAYRLKQAGIIATIYEASERVGGRCWTRRNYFKDDQMVERGGELIDTCHTEIQDIAKELGLKLDHLIMSEAIGTKPFYFFDQRPYSFQEVTDDFIKILPQLQRDLKEAGETTLYNCYTERGYELDHLSIVDYINETVPGGISSRFGKLLALAYTVEFGADASEQSALNLLYMLGAVEKMNFQMYGDSDECFHICGGNDQIPSLLAKKLQEQIHFNAELIKIDQHSHHKIKLVFKNNEKEWVVLADKVILAIPFSILKTIDYQNARFCPLKAVAIEELGMGINTKHHVQFTNRFWNELGNNGETFADTGYQQTFESSRAQPGQSGILVNYTGGENAAQQFAVTDEKLTETTRNFLDKLEPVLPGSVNNWNGLATIDHWLSNQWSKGAYSYWRVGQYTKFAGILGEREGNIFFAGEHTSIKYPGYLNGAVETGERAAQEVIQDLKIQ
ncbi:monoamine oxidase [Bacillus sp. AFS073361]|uniref:flavin monoamine oxidase family protein n=1 Tax=Bacillus sp. AFS073361 TaxID=2033511 RepID=UPI000BF32A0F|nr:NAD(P)/FAD-dependent oxidoreductase [Bacillus sp. AFS073361]PFP31052.1 monoamine oxidase [Bacillus sp. AFS073361]